MHRFLPVLVLCLIGTCLTPTAQATTVAALDLVDLAQQSRDVVHARVVSSTSRWNDDHSLIVTDVTLEVSDGLKGDAGGTLVITQLGGTVGDLKVTVPGASVFRNNDEAILFLATAGNGDLMVHGLSQGRFDVVTDRNGRKVVRGLTRDRVQRLGSKGVLPGAFATAPDRGGELPLQEFLTGVRDVIRDLPKEEGGR